MYVDGELLDNDFPFGYPQWADTNTWKLDPEYVKKAAIYLPGIKPEKSQAEATNTSPIQYWTSSRAQQLGGRRRDVLLSRTLSPVLFV